MAIIAGIDEAGLGPLLGPLVVSISAFDLPDDLINRSFWSLLAGAVIKKVSKKSPAISITDSKLMRIRSDGIVHLERGVLAMIFQDGTMPQSLNQLLNYIAPEAVIQKSHYPWYADADLPLPRQAHPHDLALRAKSVSNAMKRQGITLKTIRAEPLLAGHFNKLIKSTNNKAVVLFSLTGRLIDYVFRTYGADNRTIIIVDSQGGRVHYLRPLQQIFEGAYIKVVQESPRRSAYLVRDGQHEAEIHFCTNAEKQSLPVALASMTSKYIRELFMELLNNWWSKRLANLKPTAGYYVDGQRFIKEIRLIAKQENIDKNLLIRCR